MITKYKTYEDGSMLFVATENEEIKIGDELRAGTNREGSPIFKKVSEVVEKRPTKGNYQKNRPTSFVLKFNDL